MYSGVSGLFFCDILYKILYVILVEAGKRGWHSGNHGYSITKILPFHYLYTTCIFFPSNKFNSAQTLQVVSSNFKTLFFHLLNLFTDTWSFFYFDSNNCLQPTKFKVFRLFTQMDVTLGGGVKGRLEALPRWMWLLRVW